MKAQPGEFRPEPELRKLYYTYLLAVFVAGFLSWQVPVLLFAPLNVKMMTGIFFSLPILILFIFADLWIGRFYSTITYGMNANEITWRRGVWFRNTGIVPYNRITNIDITQGPVSRRLGIGSLKIQTAGYSAPSGRSSEIRIDGIRDFEGLREAIMSHVRGRAPMAVETYARQSGLSGPSAPADSTVLSELVRIRKLLEKAGKR